MSLYEIYKAKRLGYADDYWTSAIGHSLGGYKWISTDYEDIISVTNAQGKVRSLKINLEPIQSGSGTPSPDNVRPISGHTEVETHRTGVNVWDEEWEVGGFNADGTPLARQDAIRAKNFVSCVGDTQYYIKQGTLTDSAWSYFVFYDANKAVIGARVTAYGTVTSPTNAEYLKFTTNSSYGNTYHSDISINYPSTDHDYHAYEGATYTTPLGQTVYGGVLDVVSGELVDNRYVFEPNNTIYFGLSSQTDDVYVFLCNLSVNHLPLWASAPKLISNRFSTDTPSGTAGRMVASGNVLYFVIAKDDISGTTDSDVRQWFADHPTKFCYELATPTTYQLTPQEVKLLLGNNTIWSDGEVADRKSTR